MVWRRSIVVGKQTASAYRLDQVGATIVLGLAYLRAILWRALAREWAKLAALAPVNIPDHARHFVEGSTMFITH